VYKDKGRIRAGFENYRAGKPIFNNSQRLSQEEEVGRSAGGARNVAATSYLRGYESADNKELERRLTQWAAENDCLHTVEEIEAEFGEEIFRELEKTLGSNAPQSGSEADVYRYDGGYFLKVVRYKLYSGTPLEFLDDRIALHNHLFPDTFYELIGICLEGKAGQYSFILRQPEIKGVKPTWDDIREEMEKRKFIQIDKFSYMSNDYIVADLHRGNWIKGVHDRMYCIDPVIKLNPKNRKYENI